MDRLSVVGTLSGLRTEVQNLGKDSYDLALIEMQAAGAKAEEIEEAKELIETLREASLAVKDLSLSFEEFLSLKISGGLMNIFPEFENQAVEALANISAQFAMITFNPLLDGLSAVTAAFTKGENAAQDAKQAMAEMFQQILNQMPAMFLQAGLQLIAQGQWQLGLGFIAAAGSSAIVRGFVQGTIDKEKTVTANAHGNIFNANGVTPFAHGGSFTNQIVASPTYFRFGGKFGVMGEAGPESIMPLRRMANGDLGVAASGAGTAQVTVNIINNSGADVRQEEHTGADGNKQIEITIGQIINNHITSGKADRAMARFGARAIGV